MYNLKQTSFTPVSAPDVPFTDEQKSVLDSNEDSIIVNSVAGSGKTTLLQAISFKYPNGLYLAFNKAIVTSITNKLPLTWKCCTFHSLGLSMIKDHVPKAAVCFNKMSKYDIDIWIQGLISKHMAMAGVNTYASWRATADRFQIDTGGREADFMNYYDLLVKNTELISFDDMINYPILNQWKTDHYDCVLVDEAQDLSPSQIELLKLVPTDRIIFVGDRNQQIYSWRSSDPEVYDKLEDYYNPAQYNITQCFRCPDTILNIARGFVPEIWSDIPGGHISRKTTDLNLTPDSCFILSRTNSPLIRQARKFMKKNISFSINPQIVATLKRELNKSKHCKTIKALKLDLTRRRDRKLEMAILKDWNTSGIKDRFDMLFEAVKGQTSHTGAMRFIASLQAYSKGSSKRVLSTIHSAKGLECKDIYFINQDLCRYFITEYKKKDNALMVQEEKNLQYVACTRSLNNLTIF